MTPQRKPRVELDDRLAGKFWNRTREFCRIQKQQLETKNLFITSVRALIAIAFEIYSYSRDGERKHLSYRRGRRR
jgi:hypothetical protein